MNKQQRELVAKALLLDARLRYKQSPLRLSQGRPEWDWVMIHQDIQSPEWYVSAEEAFDSLLKFIEAKRTGVNSDLLGIDYNPGDDPPYPEE